MDTSLPPSRTAQRVHAIDAPLGAELDRLDVAARRFLTLLVFAARHAPARLRLRPTALRALAEIGAEEIEAADASVVVGIILEAGLLAPRRSPAIEALNQAIRAGAYGGGRSRT